MADPRADAPEPGLRIYHHSTVMSVSTLNDPESRVLGMVRILVAEVLREVPGADFIEIRALRYDQEKGDASGTPSA